MVDVHAVRKVMHCDENSSWTGKLQTMKPHRHTQWYMVSVPIECHGLAMAPARESVSAKLQQPRGKEGILQVACARNPVHDLLQIVQRKE